MKRNYPIKSVIKRSLGEDLPVSEQDLDEDKFKEECAIVGVIGDSEAAKLCYLALYAMQHRGHEGSGIVAYDGTSLSLHKDMGLVADVFDPETLAGLKGKLAIGHNRYATTGLKNWQNLQPLVANFSHGSVAVAHNGNLVNAAELREELEGSGAIFSTTSDTEVFLHGLARANGIGKTVDRLAKAVEKVRGAYSLVLVADDKLIAVRDPAGVRPLSLAKLGAGYIVASETCAFDLVGASFVRDLEPGEVLEIDQSGNLNSTKLTGSGADVGVGRAFCIFEYIYFSRPDSVIDGKSVYAVRKQLGVELAKEHPADVDIVIPVPDSGVPAAMGYAQQAKLPFELGLIRNHYVGRTFIEPKQSIRDFGVKVKLNATRGLLEGKRVAVVDDSVVRGTTCRKLVKMLREAGAKEVHFRISSPPTINSCYYGIDTPSQSELIAATHTLEEIREYIGANSLGYLSMEGMYKAVNGKSCDYCDACFSSNYRIGQPKNSGQSSSCNTSNKPKLAHAG